MLARSLAFTVLVAGLAHAQGTQTVIGGTANAPSRAASAKANSVGVTQSVILLKLEMWLTVPQAETLTFFRYRHHSQTGTFVQDWTQQVKVAGSSTAQWYGSNPMAMPLIAGNFYLFGVSWAGTVTYYYSTASAGQSFSFGNWYSGRTPTGLPPTIAMSGTDAAQYRMRFNTVPYTGVPQAGKPCKSATSPRLVPVEPASIGGHIRLDIAGASAQVPAIFCMSPGPLLPVSLSLFGCELWINPGILLTLGGATSTSGHLPLNVPVPQDPTLAGIQLAFQGVVAELPNLYLTNAANFTLQ
jgi:hypothetical protein